jgi:hypothetical protein
MGKKQIVIGGHRAMGKKQIVIGGHRALGKKQIVIDIDEGLNKGKRPSAAQLEQRQEEAYRLKLLGMTPEDISEKWNISARQIYDYIRAAKKRRVDELRSLEGRAGVIRQFDVLNHVIDESLKAYERSKESKKTKTAGVQTKDGSKQVGTETTKKSNQKEEEQIGDPAYLDRVMKASKDIRELLGLDAPEVKRLLVSDDLAVKDLNYDDLKSLSTEELLRRYRKTAGVGSELE